MELRDALMTRRSVRKFTDYTVNDNEISEILSASRAAPSWANVQPWEFIVVRDPETIKQIAGTYVAMNPAAKCTLAASVVIVACARKNVSGFYDNKPSTRLGDWFMFDLGMAVQNLCLRAHDLGLGTVVVGYFDHEKCKSVLGVPDNCEVVTIVPVGKPAVAGKQGPPRRELKEFAHAEKFGVPYQG